MCVGVCVIDGCGEGVTNGWGEGWMDGGDMDGEGKERRCAWAARATRLVEVNSTCAVTLSPLFVFVQRTSKCARPLLSLNLTIVS
jgi:hypothetical protein